MTQKDDNWKPVQIKRILQKEFQEEKLQAIKARPKHIPTHSWEFVDDGDLGSHWRCKNCHKELACWDDFATQIRERCPKGQEIPT